MDTKTDEINDVIELINASMNSGISRLSVNASDKVESGESVAMYHHGRCDIGSPWAKGTVTNCDMIDEPSEPDEK